MSRTPRILAVALLALSIPAGAFAQTLKIAVAGQPETLDPQSTSATSSFQATHSIYDGLVDVDPEGQIVPRIASDWEVTEDGLTWTFHLEEGVKFHNGETVSAADVIATLERVLDPELASPKVNEFETISGMSAPDDLTVVLELSEPTPALISALASGWGAILPASLIEADHDFGNEPVGSGPFVFTNWVRDSSLELTRFDDYFRGAAAIDGVKMSFVDDSSIRLQGLISGEFDVIDAPASADIDLIENHPDLKTETFPSGMVLVAAMNTRREPFDDARVRQALNLAVDKDVIIEVAYGGGFLTGTFMEAGSPWLPEGLEPWPYDPERARELLEEAGYADGFAFDLTLPQLTDAHITAGQIMQSQLAEIGITANIDIVEWGVWLNEVYGGPRDFDMTVVGHTGKLDPIGRLGGYEADTNYVGFTTPELSELLLEAAVVSDLDERAELYGEALWILHEQTPWVYLGTPYARTTTRANVEGFWLTPLLDTFNFYEAELR